MKHEAEAKIVVQRAGLVTLPLLGWVSAEFSASTHGALASRREFEQAEEALLDAFALERVAKMDAAHLAHELRERGVQAVHFFSKGGT